MASFDGDQSGRAVSDQRSTTSPKVTAADGRALPAPTLATNAARALSASRLPLTETVRVAYRLRPVIGSWPT